MYSRLRFIWNVEGAPPSRLPPPPALCGSGLGTASIAIGIARAAEISGNGMIDMEQLLPSSQRCWTRRNMFPRMAPSMAPYTRLSFSPPSGSTTCMICFSGSFGAFSKV